ncbi:TetR/AcrR family transcriptional regulator [Bacillus weihaiensis]|uniref:TetR family transcriptional regulator n=1 Tax=Bacillus weihaiensis TaxID=1547283 RepID=A0A1L3MVD0_9BACI|nr:TetR/AcrR family transcriptional regulator [Bacillus weihaiensis]APH06284.1 TetR family transcriptional regulator [Bacillus weihaiensis]
MSIDRRRLIIEAATESFSLFGYKATTMDQVAKIANVGKGTIYTFFKNKEELFDEIIASLIKEMKMSAEEAMDEKKSFHENASSALYTLLGFRKKHQLMIKLIQEEREMGTREVLEVIKRLEKMIVTYIKEIVQKAIDKKEIKPCNPEMTAFVMLKLYVSLIVDWEKDHEPLDKDEMFQLFDLYLFKGLSRS